jgi:hypothetical protein
MEIWIIGIILIIIYLLIDRKTKAIKEYINSKGGRFDSYNPISLSSYGYNLIEKLRLNPFEKETFYSVKYYDKNEVLHEAVISLNVDLKVKLYEDKIIK